jgi:hypothetical protein
MIMMHTNHGLPSDSQGPAPRLQHSAAPAGQWAPQGALQQQVKNKACIREHTSQAAHIQLAGQMLPVTEFEEWLKQPQQLTAVPLEHILLSGDLCGVGAYRMALPNEFFWENLGWCCCVRVMSHTLQRLMMMMACDAGDCGLKLILALQ